MRSSLGLVLVPLLLAGLAGCEHKDAESRGGSEFAVMTDAPVGDNMVGLIACHPPRNPRLLGVGLNIRPEATEVLFKFGSPADLSGLEVLRAEIRLDSARVDVRVWLDNGDLVASSVEQGGEALDQEVEDVSLTGSKARLYFGPPATDTIAKSMSLKFWASARVDGEDIQCRR